jgi:ABC-type multidrug transport system permease subunit
MTIQNRAKKRHATFIFDSKSEMVTRAIAGVIICLCLLSPMLLFTHFKSIENRLVIMCVSISTWIIAAQLFQLSTSKDIAMFAFG